MFSICLLTDYMSHESLKEFWKNTHFENMRAGFLCGVKIHFSKLTLEMMHFQPWKKMFCQFYVLVLDPIEIRTQNDRLELSFVKDFNVVAETPEVGGAGGMSPPPKFLDIS